MRKGWLLGLLLCCSIANATVELGKDYKELVKKLPSSTDSKTVEVVEFFQYTCAHCSELELVLAPWLDTKPEGVNIKRVHVIWQKSMEGLARFYGTELATQTEGKLHRLAFDAVLQKRIDLGNETSLVGWLKTVPGVDIPSFMRAYKSFEVDASVGKAKKMTQDYSVDGTPMIIVAGKYVLLPATPKRLLVVLKELIAKVRKEQNSK